MSAFLMNEKSVSDLAYNVFTKGQGNSRMVAMFEKENIHGPEDLFRKLRWANMVSLIARYEDKFTKKDIGAYDFDHREMNLCEMVKKISCWQYQSCESEKVCKSGLFKAMGEFARDCAYKYMIQSEEYEDAAWE